MLGRFGRDRHFFFLPHYQVHHRYFKTNHYFTKCLQLANDPLIFQLFFILYMFLLNIIIYS